MISFGAPWMLWGLLAIAVPLLLHLWFRRQYQTETWAAMQFLQRAQEKMSQRLRWRQIITLVVRCLLLAFLVLALAEPLWNPSGATSSSTGDSRHTLFVLDNSYSMSRTIELESNNSSRISLFERSKQALQQRVERYVPGDRNVLFQTTTLSPASKTSESLTDRAQIERFIEQLQPAAAKSDYDSTLESVIDLLKSGSTTGEKEVVLISDFQNSDWGERSGQLEQQLKEIQSHAVLRLIDVNLGLDQPMQNLAVTKISTNEPPVLNLEKPSTFFVEVTNFGTEDVEDTSVSFQVNQGPVQETVISVPSGESQMAEFQYQFQIPGSYQVRGEIPDDDLLIDNQSWSLVNIREQQDVLLVTDDVHDQTQTRFLEAALTSAAESGFSPVRLTKQETAQLPVIDLNFVQTIVCCNVRMFLPEEAERLSEYVKQGGTLIVWLGDQVQAENYNEVLGKSLLDVKLLQREGNAAVPEHEFPVAATSLTHPVFEPFVSEGSGSLGEPLIFEYFATAPYSRKDKTSKRTTKPILSFENGAGLIWETAGTKGRVLLVTTSADNRWGPWPLQPGFPPLVHRLVEYGITQAESPTEFQVGDKLRWNRKSNETPQIQNTYVLAPNGHTLLADETSDESEAYFLVKAEQPGIYAVHTSSDQDSSYQKYAVALETVESDLSSWPEADRSDWFKQHTYSLTDLRQGRLGRPVSLSFVLLMLVLVFLGIDQWMNRKRG